jgi:cardiolipin synthase C
VKLTVMTNSIATTDEPLVHFGYARYRRAMLKMGVTLYELMPTDGKKSDAIGELHASLGRLHAKLAVVGQPVPVHRLDEHGRPLGALEHRGGSGDRQP